VLHFGEYNVIVVDYHAVIYNGKITGEEITPRELQQSEHSEGFHSTDRNVLTVTQAQILERAVPYFGLYNCRVAAR